MTAKLEWLNARLAANRREGWVSILVLLAAVLGTALGLVLISCGTPGRSGDLRAQATPIVDFQWGAIQEGALQEGRLVLVGPDREEVRIALTESFQERYPDIEVEYVPIPPTGWRTLLARLGSLTPDVIVTDPATARDALAPSGLMTELPELLIGPVSRDLGSWLHHQYSWADSERRYALVFSGYSKEAFAYHASALMPGEIVSWDDLLEPRWRGRIALKNPRAGGTALDTFAFFYANDRLGPDFILSLLAHAGAAAESDTQLLDWVANGTYPIAIGVSSVMINEYADRGLPVRAYDGSSLREGTYLAAELGVLLATRDSPRPNAARVYIDHLLSRDAQNEWAKLVGLPSLRQDVPRGDIPDALIAKGGVSYLENYTTGFLHLRDDAARFVNAVFPR